MAHVPPPPVRVPLAAMTYSAPVMHTIPQSEEPIFHSGNMEANDKVNDLQEKYEMMNQEMKALRGKEKFGKTAYDLCLVPNVQIPHKFKIPDFEKYKGNSCPEEHLKMYARRMSAYARDDQVLIYYFQESLASPASKWYTNLDKTKIQTFRDLCEAFVEQYSYNVDMAPDRCDLQAMTQENKETFKEYAQRWRDTAAQVNPRIEEKEMTKLFLKTLNSFYYERMVGSTPKNFAEMVGMGVQLEEGVRQGRLVKDATSASGTKKFGSHLPRKKEQEVGMVAHGRSQQTYPIYQPVAAITPAAHTIQPTNSHPQSPQYPQFPQYPQQQYPQQQYPQPQYQQQYPQPQYLQQQYPQQNLQQPYQQQLLPGLLKKNLVQTRAPPPVPEKLSSWYRLGQTCDFHQGGRGHNIETCYAFKSTVQRLINDGKITFTDSAPNVQTNPLPNHGAAAVNMVEDCQRTHLILDVQHIQTPLVSLHAKLCKVNLFEHDHDICEVRKSTAAPLVICLPGPIPYVSEKAIPYKYNATMIEGGHEVPIPPLPYVSNVAGDSRILRNGHVVPIVFSKKDSAPMIEEAPAKDPSAVKEVSQSNGANPSSEFDEILKLIKKSEYRVVDQLMQTPSKISIMSLLLNSEAHKEALMKVLEQAFVDYDATVGQFGGIVGNIIACNNLSFSDEELPAEGKNHNLALHISVNCKTDALSNVLVDTGSALNMMAKTTYDQLSYQGMPLRRSGVMVKAFDGSRKNVLGEVLLPITIGPQVFQINFQVMDIQVSYSCLLGRPWIHEAGAVTSTLHQKLKFVRNGKLVTVNGEEALLVSHLSSFLFIGADSVEGTPFQGFSMEEERTNKSEASISSLKDAHKVIQAGGSASWGKLIELPENKRREGLGFFPSADSSKTRTVVEPIKGTFHSSGFIHAIIKDDPEEVPRSFVTQGGSSHNWVAVDVPFIAHLSK
ncbi:uncharacterized protein [Medicago truncatula]|uniref:uncharacterized protein n=1 Tax=Medicago truncatula TaxID=3880 RepID=UPI0019672D80|nr:uncharacterized protein LOC112420115 [Medicago truncatula]